MTITQATAIATVPAARLAPDGIANEITWLEWASPDTALRDFAAKLTAFRQAHPDFCRRRFLAGTEASELQWLAPARTLMTDADWANPNAGPSPATRTEQMTPTRSRKAKD